MTKKTISLVLALLLCVALSVTAFATGETRLVDGADLLTVAEERTLTETLDTISETYQVDVVIVTTDTTGALTPDEYITFFYEEGGYGYGNSRDGVILLVAVEDRAYRILSVGLGAESISQGDIDTIGNRIQPALSSGDYFEAFNDFAEECEEQIDGEIHGFPFNFAKNLLISLVIGFVIALIITGAMKGQLKSVKMQLAATQYTKPGSMHLTDQHELFLYRNVSRHKKQTANASSKSRSRSRSSRNIGGGSF